MNVLQVETFSFFSLIDIIQPRPFPRLEFPSIVRGSSDRYGSLVEFGQSRKGLRKEEEDERWIIRASPATFRSQSHPGRLELQGV